MFEGNFHQTLYLCTGEHCGTEGNAQEVRAEDTAGTRARRAVANDMVLLMGRGVALVAVAGGWGFRCGCGEHSRGDNELGCKYL